MVRDTKSSRRHLATVVICCLLLPGGAFAVQPDEILKDPALEARARSLSAELRCLVCQNQSIDESDAPLAKDLRILVRERLKAGDTDAEVQEFLVDRYGEFVLLKPVLGLHTLLLWLTPLVVFALGGFGLLRMARRKTLSRSTELSPEEQARIDSLMKPEG
jgi:cytochrome c-type biogenesis protein CcmH